MKGTAFLINCRLIITLDSNILVARATMKDCFNMNVNQNQKSGFSSVIYSLSTIGLRVS